MLSIVGFFTKNHERDENESRDGVEGSGKEQEKEREREREWERKIERERERKVEREREREIERKHEQERKIEKGRIGRSAWCNLPIDSSNEHFGNCRVQQWIKNCVEL